MSSKNTFCEVNITKNKQIFLTIDLTKKEPIKKKSGTKAPPLSPPKTLYEFATRHMDEITNKLTPKIHNQEEKIDSSKTLRKLAKKIITSKKLRLSEIAIEVYIFSKWLRMREKVLLLDKC